MPDYIKLILPGTSPHVDQVVDFRHVNGLRAMVYDSLACVDPVFAQEMHADTWTKPLTLSPLWWRDVETLRGMGRRA